MIGYGICGSFCTHAKSIEVLKALAGKYDMLPVLSFNAAALDTRFGKAQDLIQKAEDISGKKAVMSIVEAEPLGPKTPMEAFIIAPCTGNTLAKIANGITDTPVTMAAKAHLRTSRPLIICLASNDSLSANLKNIAALTEKKSVYFVPLRQDDPEKKPYSLVADFSMIEKTLEFALEGKQLRPLFK